MIKKQAWNTRVAMSVMMEAGGREGVWSSQAQLEENPFLDVILYFVSLFSRSFGTCSIGYLI